MEEGWQSKRLPLMAEYLCKLSSSHLEIILEYSPLVLDEDLALGKSASKHEEPSMHGI
jgi:hypothetical protein